MDQETTAGGGLARLHNSHLFQAWLVLMLSVLFGACLATVHINFSGVIADNKLNESLERIPGLIWSGPESVNPVDKGEPVDIYPGRIGVAKQDRTVFYPVFQVIHKEKVAGWVIKAAGQGYAGRIELLIGLDPEGERINGLFVLEQKETPGLGNKIISPTWRQQFVGQKTDHPLVVVKGDHSAPGAIDAITGATISSRSVATIINRAIDETRGRLGPPHVQLFERQP